MKMIIKLILYTFGVFCATSHAGDYSKKQEEKYNVRVVKDFLKRDEVQNILSDIIQKNADTPLLQKITQAFKTSFSYPHIHRTLTQVLGLLNTYVIYPFYDKEDEYGEGLEFSNIASDPQTVLTKAIASVLLSKFIAAYYTKHQHEIEASESIVCQKNKDQHTLFTYLTCDAQDKQKGAIFSDVLKIILTSIQKEDYQTQKSIYAVLKRIARKKASFTHDDMLAIRLLLKQILSTV